MVLHQLSIVNYKNIANAELQFSTKINCLIGGNGEGKTNLLDAIHFLSLCRSMTTTLDAACIRHDADMAFLQGAYTHEDGTREDVSLGLRRGQKKQLKRNKKSYPRLADHIGLIPLVVVSPADGLLISGGSEERRRFMDVVISQYDRRYLDALVAYNKALQQRNALLRAEAPADELMVGLWEEEMARHGEVVFRARDKYIKEFIPTFEQFYAEISGARESVSLEYVSHCQRGPLLDVIRGGRAKDQVMGYSLHGVHRDDLTMTLGGYPIRREGSQGQNKSYLIAMKLAQFDFLRRTGSQTTPLLLLDDIFDKLDAARVEQIVGIVASERFGQIFVTDTNRDHLDGILASSESDYRLFRVSGGEVSL